MLRKLYDWLGEKVHSPHATSFLACLFFIEALFFIPVDPILMLFCLEKRKKSMFYAAIATISSVAGGITGYGIGFYVWHTVGLEILTSKLVASIISLKTFHYLSALYETYSHWAILIAGLTPVPYKAATLTAGFCNISFLPFILFSLIARGTRFFLIAGIIKIWGNQIKEFIDRYFNLLVTLALVTLCLVIWMLK